MEIIVNEYQLPVVKMNYEQLETELKNMLMTYKGLAVTDDTLQACKEAQKELARLRLSIDEHRKEKKKELSAPIVEFEEKCKKLIAMVTEAEEPIKAGIKFYDDAKREEKRKAAEEIAREIAKEVGLNEKYAASLTILDKYMNLTASKKSVREDLEIRAFALKVEQDKEEERMETIMSVLEMENKRLKNPMSVSDFAYYIENGMGTAGVIEKIKEQAERVYKAENYVPEPVAEEKKEETPVEVKQNEPEKYYTMVVRFTGTLAQMQNISAKIKESGIGYKVIEKSEV